MDLTSKFPHYNGETILSKIAFYAKTTPQKTCIIEATNGEKISYRDFWNSILDFSMKIEPGLRYIMQTRQTIAHLIAFYGIQAAGSIAIPVEAKTPEERLEEMSLEFSALIMQPML